MPRAKQLTVQLANKPGTLAQVAEALGRAGVNMRALAVFEGRAKIIADDPARGREALQQEGLYASIEDCLTVDMTDQPGALGGICAKLAAAGVNIDYAYTGITQSAGKAVVVLVVSDLEKAAKLTA
ncbi:MAG TPA: ACT domain-containing protein [Candidatus Polarisedimenticolia bacterium]|nr:ACT domain-containing protein [Candidatus Polarisedimenticolia bacterium]